MNTRWLPMLLSSVAVTVGCAASSSTDGDYQETSALVADESIAGAWVATTGDVRALVLTLGDSRSLRMPRAFTAIVASETVRGTWALEGDRLRLTNSPGGLTPQNAENAGEVAYANAMRKAFGEHRVQRQGNRFEIIGGPLAAKFTYHGASYCDDLVADQCVSQSPTCEGRDVPNPAISNFKSMPFISGNCLVEEKRCELYCTTSYRGAQLDRQEFVIGTGEALQIFGTSQLSRAFPKESYEWKSESPSVTVATATETLPTYPLGTYDLNYRIVVDKNATSGSVHRVKHASSPWSFTIRVR